MANEIDEITKAHIARDNALAMAKASDDNADAWRQRAIECGWTPILKWDGWDQPMRPVPHPAVAELIVAAKALNETVDKVWKERDNFRNNGELMHELQVAQARLLETIEEN